MRRLHTFEREDDANALKTILFGKGIDTQVREADPGHALWVEDDSHLGDAKETLAAFLADPNASEFSEAKTQARERQNQERAKEKVRKQNAARVARARTDLRGGMTGAHVTMAIIGVCALLFGAEIFLRANMGPLKVLSYTTGVNSIGRFVELMKINLELRPWSFLTAAFLHGGWLHIIFNMMWMAQLGAIIERMHRGRTLLAMTILFGMGGTIAQLAIGGSAIGMSGVVYGLFGFLWARGRFDPTYPLRLNQGVVTMMMGWFLLCFVLPFGIANGAHTAGLVLGGIWGYLSSAKPKRA